MAVACGGPRHGWHRPLPAGASACLEIRWGGAPGRCSRRSESSSAGREPVGVCRTSGGDPRRHGVLADAAEKVADVSLRILCRGQKLFREGRLWSNSRRHGRMRRPAGSHELKPAILDLHSAPMQPVRWPGKRGAFCGAGASRPPKLRSGGSGETSRNTSGCRPGPQPDPARCASLGGALAEGLSHPPARRGVQTGSLHPFDHPGRRIYPRAVCDPVSKPTAAELVTAPPVRDMRAAFERVRETFPVVIRGARPTAAPSSAVPSGSCFRSGAWPCSASSHAVPDRMAASSGARAPGARSSTKPSLPQSPRLPQAGWPMFRGPPQPCSVPCLLGRKDACRVCTRTPSREPPSQRGRHRPRQENQRGQDSSGMHNLLIACMR